MPAAAITLASLSFEHVTPIAGGQLHLGDLWRLMRLDVRSPRNLVRLARVRNRGNVGFQDVEIDKKAWRIERLSQ